MQGDHHEHGHHHHGHDHHDHAGHGHAHGAGGHHHAPASFGRAFAIGTALNAGFVCAEVVYGLAANSLALLADAAHNLGDVLGLLLAWGAVWLSKRSPTERRTYGYARSSILASLINAIVLLIGVGGIAWESLQRLAHPEPVVGGTVMWVAGVGIAINGLTALMFMSGGKHDLNIRGAFLHMAADAVVSLGVVLATFAITLTGWLWLDSATSLVIAVVITIGAWGLLRDSANLALDAVPARIDRGAVEAYLRGLPGVVEVHDLHIWGLSTTDTALTVHLVRPTGTDDDGLIARVSAELKSRFSIGHATIQLETAGSSYACALAPANVI
jgi:cobalt-zinc-cadmium efflux system protein